MLNWKELEDSLRRIGVETYADRIGNFGFCTMDIRLAIIIVQRNMLFSSLAG